MSVHYAPHLTSHPRVLHKHAHLITGAYPTLASNRLIGFVASSLIGIFLPIFLYEFFGMSLNAVLLWFGINFLVKTPFFVPAAKLFSRIGLIRSMMIGTVGLALAYLMFFLLDHGTPMNPYLLMGIAVFGFGLTSTLYWSPFHIDFAKFSSKKHRGVQVGMFYATQRLFSVVAPIIAAFLIAHFGYYASFLGGMLLTLASILPLFFLPSYQVHYEFGFWETFQKLFSKKFRAMSLSMMALGAEDIVGTVVWPVFLFSVFQGNYLKVGAVTAVIVVIAFLLEYIVGKDTDTFSPRKMLKIGSWVYAFGWISKGFVDTILGVFAASTFHSFGSIMMRTPLDTLSYQQAADSGHYIDEYTVLREMALNIGRVLILFVLIPITTTFSITSSFLLAAFVSLGVNWLVNYHARTN